MAKLSTLYTMFRERGFTAHHAFANARTVLAFDSLGPDKVRISILPDHDADMDSLKGDTFSRRVNPDIPEHVMRKQEEAFEREVERKGVWYFLTEYCDPRTGTWKFADSCHGFIGENDPYTSGYAYDGMHSAVRAYNDALAKSRRFHVAPGRVVMDNGVPTCYLSIIQNRYSGNLAMRPTDADTLTHRIVYLLNRYGTED